MPRLTEGLKTDILWGSSAFSLILEHFQNTFKSLNILSSVATIGLIFRNKFHIEKRKQNIPFWTHLLQCQPRLWLIWWAEQKRSQTKAVLETGKSPCYNRYRRMRKSLTLFWQHQQHNVISAESEHGRDDESAHPGLYIKQLMPYTTN